jgi:glycosyltransferase involved in cell wall biosynthesis
MTGAMPITASRPGADGRRIRVLWLVKGLGAGGAERLLVSLARVADHERFEYVVGYVLPHKTAFRPALEAAGVRVVCLSEPGDGRLGWVRRLHRMLVQDRFDIVHTHSPVVAGVTRVVARLSRQRRPALVSTEHNSWASYLWPTRLLNATLHVFDDRRFAVSTQARDSMWPPLRRGVEVLVHGVVLEDYLGMRVRRDAERERLGLAPDAVVVSTVANLRREKGYPELLAAARDVLRQQPGTVFLAAGQGALEGQLRAEHRRLRLGDGFRFLGQVDDVPALLAASDVFVLPSRFEGTPIAIMEALCMGLPVVGTSVGGIPEQVTDGQQGLIVPPRDARALTEALLALVRDPQTRARMSSAAELRGADFDIRHAAARTESTYLSLVGASVGTGNPGLTPPSP